MISQVLSNNCGWQDSMIPSTRGCEDLWVLQPLPWKTSQRHNTATTPRILVSSQPLRPLSTQGMGFSSCLLLNFEFWLILTIVHFAHIQCRFYMVRLFGSNQSARPILHNLIQLVVPLILKFISFVHQEAKWFPNYWEAARLCPEISVCRIRQI